MSFFSNTFRDYTNFFSQQLFDLCLDINLKLGDDIKNSNKSQDKHSLCQSLAHAGPSSSHCFKTNASKNANTSGDGSANNTTNNNVKMEGEIFVTNVND